MEVLFKWFFCPGLSPCCLLVVPQPPPGGSRFRTSEQLEGAFIRRTDGERPSHNPRFGVRQSHQPDSSTQGGLGNTSYWMCIRMLLIFTVSELEAETHWTLEGCREEM